jgi:hypothetical protein
MRTFLVSYATASFAKVRSDLNKSAIDWGVENIFSFTEADLHRSEFYHRHQPVLDEICGAGYWAWKPYFISEALTVLNDGDILIYADAGCAFLESPQPLISLCANQARGLVLFDARPLSNRQFTKRDCFVRMGCDAAPYWDAPKVIATVLLVRKTTETTAFIAEWLQYCTDRACVSDDANICGLANLDGFLQHRWDQAILSVLAAKHQLETFRNPSEWGNFLKMPSFRRPGERIVSPYAIPPPVNDYWATPQENSSYGTIFAFNRQPNYVGKKMLEFPSPPPPRSLKQKIADGIREYLE